MYVYTYIHIHIPTHTQAKALPIASNVFGAAIKVRTSGLARSTDRFHQTPPTPQNRLTTNTSSPTHTHTAGTHTQACDRSAQYAKAVDVGEAMLAAGLAPLPRAVKAVLVGADRARLYERVGACAFCSLSSLA